MVAHERQRAAHQRIVMRRFIGAGIALDELILDIEPGGFAEMEAHQIEHHIERRERPGAGDHRPVA